MDTERIPWAARLALMAGALTLLSPGCGRGPGKTQAPTEAPGPAEAAPAEPTTPPVTTKLTEADFEEAISKGVALVDFWSRTCPPCSVQGPIVDKVAAVYEGRALVGKLEVESAPDVVGTLGIWGIPTLIVFKDGQEARRAVGLQTEEKLRAMVDEVLAEK